MNSNDHPLRTTSLKVLDEWAMMMVDEPADISPKLFDRDKPVYMSWVDLHGVITGAVSLVAQEPFLNTLANNILGESGDEVHSTYDCKDAFKEMVNVLAGNFLTEAFGDEVVFDLYNPNVSEVPFEDLEKFLRRQIVFTFIADESPVAVTFSIKK